MIRVLAAGDTALTIEIDAAANAETAARVLELDRRIAASAPVGLVECVPTLRSLTVHFDPLVTDPDAVRSAVLPLTEGLAATSGARRRVTLPVCYAPTHAVDLEEVARRCGLSPADVVAAHAGARHRVMMIGFLPGQPYIAGLPSALELPRRETPRTVVPAGSVAIATTMTTIYPLASPGGWHIIGRTPARLFDLTRASPVLLEPGDEIAFRSVSEADLATLEGTPASDGGVVIERLDTPGEAP